MTQSAYGVRSSLRTHGLLVVFVSMLLIFALGGWATTTEFAGAVVAPAQVIVDSNVKKIQHLTGGVVGDLRVRDGVHVKAGDILIRLDDIQTRANLAIVRRFSMSCQRANRGWKLSEMMRKRSYFRAISWTGSIIRMSSGRLPVSCDSSQPGARRATDRKLNSRSVLHSLVRRLQDTTRRLLQKLVKSTGSARSSQVSVTCGTKILFPTFG